MFNLASRQRLDAQDTYCLPPESARNKLKRIHPVNPCGAENSRQNNGTQSLFRPIWRAFPSPGDSASAESALALPPALRPQFILLSPHSGLVSQPLSDGGDRRHVNREGNLNDDNAPAKLVARTQYLGT